MGTEDLNKSGMTMPPDTSGDAGVYRGALSQTQREPMLVPLADGTHRTVHVYTVVNVATDPQLRQAALDGTLHQLGPVALAVPYVYHDPEARKFVLVVPHALCHRELRERASLLTRLADDAQALPSYVHHGQSVLGNDGLAEFLVASTPTEIGAMRAGLGEREQRLVDRAESLTRFEDEMRSQREQLIAIQHDLSIREQALEERFARLQRREAQVEEAEAKRRRFENETEGIRDSSVQVLDDELDEVDDIDAEGDVEALEAAGVVDEANEVVDDEVDELEEVDDDSVVPDLEMNPPEGFVESPDAEMASVVNEGDESLWLFVRLDEGREAEFDDPDADVDLLAQWVNVHGYPVVLLTLACERDGVRPYARRMAVDPYSVEGKDLLERLTEEFAAEVALYAADGQLMQTFSIGAPREANVARILEKVAEQWVDPSTDVDAVLERAVAAPPPFGTVEHAFQLPSASSDDLGSMTAVELAARLETLSDWAADDKLDEALLVLSVPWEEVETTFDTLLSCALEQGVCLGGVLRRKAVERGLASDEAELVLRLCESYLDNDGSGGVEFVAANWERLLDAAHVLDLALLESVVDSAWSAICATHAEGDRLRAVEPADVPNLPPEDLALVLRHPHLRTMAIGALCDDGSHAREVLKAFRALTREEMADVGGALVALGDSAVDGLIQALDDPAAHVRQGAVLLLGSLKAQRAVVPLAHLLKTESTEAWREVARVLGGYGSNGFRALVRSLRDPKSDPSRLVVALSHAALGDDRERLKKLTKDPDSAVAEAASRALERAEQAAQEARRITGDASDSGLAPHEEFSRQFLGNPRQ